MIAGRSAAALALASALLLSPACLFDGERLSITEYTQWCSSLTEGDLFREDQSWAELAELTQTWLARYEAVSPPSELRRIHSEQQDAVRLILSLAEEKPPDDPVSPTAFLELAADALPIAAALEREFAELDPQIQDRLIAAGCLTANVFPGG